jgi:glycosyltransferase involved in cell wall biosynthesis
MTRDCASAPLLSVLIPAYNQSAGVERAVASLLHATGRGDVELIVADDSSDELAADKIERIVQTFPQAIYRRNRPALGAVPNWNSLLAGAHGRYCIVLHHDEAFAEPAALPRLLDALGAAESARVWILACSVATGSVREPRLHFPPRLAAAVARRFPAYLFRRNLIGPPSALIVRREDYLPYDRRLQWYVDVECYFRILSTTRSVAPWLGAGVISHTDAVNSITASLSSRLSEIKRAERLLLAAAYGHLGQTRWLFSPSIGARCVRSLETLVWGLFRLVQRTVQVAQGARDR